jgi:hypothetical protein
MAEEKETTRKEFRQCIPPEAKQHAEAAREEMRKSFAALFPPEFIAHRRAARREFLLAARELIDYALDRVDTKVNE